MKLSAMPTPLSVWWGDASPPSLNVCPHLVADHWSTGLVKYRFNFGIVVGT